jgi:hypothetical protein
MIGATVEVADFEEFKTPQIAWILLRTFVDDHEIARHAWKSSGLRPNIFQYCGFGGSSIYEFLKLLCTTDQPPDITELRQMFPGYFKTLDRVDFRFDRVAPVARFLIDEARYLHNARALGLSHNIEVDDRSRRHVVERQIRNRIAVRIRALCSALLPYGGDFGEDWVALSRGLGSIAVRVKGSTIGYWHASNGDHSISSRSAVLLVQAIQNLNLSAALDWITNFFDRAGEAAGAIVAPPDAEDEDESLLHSLATPDPDSLPRVTAEALQEKRKLVIEGMKADRACLAARPASKPVEPDADLNQPAVHNDADAPTTSQNLSAALKHAGAGFAVFLCDQHKKPRGKWRDISTTDPETIRLWFQTWPDSIVGIDLAKSGLIVVDADRHDPEHDGVDALARLESENEPFENHPIIWTPRNGFHHVFRQPPGIPLGNATGALPKGIDIRGAGGFVIACGSISTVFGEWVAADGSLIEAFRAGTIPTLPDWLAAIIQTRPTEVQPSDNVVPFKPRDPKEEVPKEPGAAPRPPSSPTLRQKKRAAAALQGNAAELATTQPGNRNNRLNVLSYRMGRFVSLGSITRQHVIEAFTAGCEANGLIQDDGIDSVMRTIKSGLDAGMKKPLEDIAAKSSEKGQGRNPYEREVQRSEVMALFRLRFGPHASYEAVDDVLAKIDSDDKEVIGRELGFTFEQYKRMGVEPLGRRRAKHPSTIKPFNATDDEIQAHLKECEKSRNSAAHKKQRAKLAEARKAVEDLDDRSSAVLTFLQHSAGPQSIAQIAAGIRKSRAFADLTDNALRRTILRLVTPPSKLAEMVVLTEGKTKNGRKTFFVGVRK